MKVPPETRQQIRDQLEAEGKWQQLTPETGRKYVALLAKWAFWWRLRDVKALREKTGTAITEKLLHTFCRFNITQHSCQQFKAAMILLHVEAL